MTRAEELIEQLELIPHPEGGHYREIYRSDQQVDSCIIAGRTNASPRSALTQIYFLLRAGEVSRWHVVSSDEAWHFYEGDPLRLITYNPTSQTREEIGLGTLSAGHTPCAVVPAHVWQAATPSGGYSLVGCDVAPGFEFTDFRFVSQLERSPDPFSDALLDDATLL